MIVLTDATDFLKVTLSGNVTTNQLQCFVSWNDVISKPNTTIPGRNISLTDNTNDVTLASIVSDKRERVINYISVFNNDTVNATVTIKMVSDSVDYILFRTTLASGEKLEYQDGQGFRVIATSGAVKQSINQGSNTISTGLTAVVLGSDVINNNAVANTIQDVTGLSFPVLANKMYWFKFIIRYTAAATTTGSRWGVNCTAGLATNLSMTSEYSLTSTTTTRNANVQAFDSPAASNATSASTTNNMAIMEGYFIPTADGIFIARFASEVLSSAITAKAGSVCYYQQLN